MTQRQKMTRYLSASLAMVVAIAWVVSANLPASEEQTQRSPDGAPPLTVSTAPVAYSEQLMRPRSFTGKIVAARSSRLSFEQSGRIVSFGVDEGDTVEEGQVLASMDLATVASRLASARAAVQQAQAQLDELVAGPRAEAIASTRANATSLDAELSRLEQDFQRAEQLLGSQAISQERFDATRFQRDAAQARRDAAQRQLDELLAGTRPEKIAAQRAQLAGLQANVHTLELELADAQLIAPFSGRVAQRFLDEGTVVTPGQSVLELVEDKQLEAWIGLSPVAANALQRGSQYTGEAGGRSFAMQLRSLRPQLDDRTRTQNAVFEVEPTATSGRLVPGQIVRVTLQLPVESRGMLVPTSSMVPAPRGLWSVYVAVPHEDTFLVEQRDVTVVETLGTRSLVTGTLEPGMQLIVDGVHRVVPGQRVSVRETALATEEQP